MMTHSSHHNSILLNHYQSNLHSKLSLYFLDSAKTQKNSISKNVIVPNRNSVVMLEFSERFFGFNRKKGLREGVLFIPDLAVKEVSHVFRTAFYSEFRTNKKYYFQSLLLASHDKITFYSGFSKPGIKNSFKTY